VLLLGVFSLNYAFSATENTNFISRIDILDLMETLTEKVPSTARYVRTVINIATGIESNSNAVITDRFTYYMGRISDNSQTFNDI
jgi:hypothetical protein